MRYFRLWPILLIVSCKTVGRFQDLEPTCMQDTVEKILAIPPKTPRAEIHQGTYNGEKIYVYKEQRDGREFSIVLNDKCEYLCEVGGFASLNNCPDLMLLKLKNIEIIWLDPR
ncbi:DUF6970 domain-containing protein [Croceivirga lutea]|uniref:DUF6970 domain-containing protein n=1 Tax=Croceivirga lutea TaxID=1775167 RepID=UPI001639545E|nr:hypothetical protein [Croceivirga lutea]